MTICVGLGDYVVIWIIHALTVKECIEAAYFFLSIIFILDVALLSNRYHSSNQKKWFLDSSSLQSAFVCHYFSIRHERLDIIAVGQIDDTVFAPRI